MTNYVITNKLAAVCKAEGMIPTHWPIGRKRTKKILSSMQRAKSGRASAI